jgi:hypothetical protein
MPILATASKGTINIVLEGTPGEQIALATTPVSATLTGISAPTGSTGARYHIKITNWTASGTVTITGTGTPNNTETYNIATPTLQQTQSPQLASNEYVTVNAYTAITNITTTGLASGLITVWQIPAGKYQLSGVMQSKRAPKDYSPNEHNAYIERDKKLMQLTNASTIDSIKQDVYADLSLWWCYMMMGAPTSIVTYPASPTSLFTSTAITNSTTTLTPLTQPTAPGMKLIVTTSAFTTAGTLTVLGTVNGVSGVSEIISITGTGTVYSSNVYSAITSITNATTSATLGITGVYGWGLTFGSSAQLYSAAIEWFDGTGSWTHPFSFATEGDFDIKVQTEASLTIKGKCQDKLPIGDRTTSPLSGINRIAAIGANLNDEPIVGWQSVVYLDPITGTPQTSLYTNVEELKVSIKTPQEEHWTFTNSQNINRAYAQKRECTCEATLDFIDMSQWEQFRQNLKQYLVFQFLGQYLGTAGGSPVYKSWTWTLPIRTDGNFDPTSDPTKGSVTAKAMWRAEIDPGLGGAYRLVVITQNPPTYPL